MTETSPICIFDVKKRRIHAFYECFAVVWIMWALDDEWFYLKSAQTTLTFSALFFYNNREMSAESWSLTRCAPSSKQYISVLLAFKLRFASSSSKNTHRHSSYRIVSYIFTIYINRTSHLNSYLQIHPHRWGIFFHFAVCLTDSQH